MKCESPTRRCDGRDVRPYKSPRGTEWILCEGCAPLIAQALGSLDDVLRKPKKKYRMPGSHRIPAPRKKR